MTDETTTSENALASAEADGSSLFRSTGEAIEVLSKALPDLHCPVCRNDTFDLLGDIDNNLISKTLVYPREFTVTTQWYPTVGVACQSCGHILSFSTFRLRRLAESKSAEGGNV